jgi:protein phosphatase
VARIYALTDVGRSREHNEDTFLVADLESGAALEFAHGHLEITPDAHGLLFMVADGMGGAASGELASSMASTLVLDALRASWTAAAPSVGTFTESLRDATVNANARIHQYAREYPEHRGMGTTATIAGLLGDRLYVVQVGDSRAYLVREGTAYQLTKDQSLMQRLVEAGEMTPEEAEASDRRNIILQALGPEAHVTVDLTHQQVRRGDTLILCSDGLSGLVKADEIAWIASGEESVRGICARLIERANQRGGPDNITVVAARFDGDALEATSSSDTTGYTAFPLAGTLNDESRVPTPLPPRKRAPIKSDPTREIALLTPVPAPPVLADVDDAFAQTQVPDPVELGAPEPVVAQRREKVQPVYLLLASLALAAALWTAWMLFR